MKKRLFGILILVLTFWVVSGQKEVPLDYFEKPLEIPLILSGTFGELRSNHFHSGLDIKTQQRTGLKVKAAAAGTVSRIKISHFGYGKALYIQHPNGYSTVYAHLKKFSPEIEAYVKKQQYKKEAFEIELFPKPGLFNIEKGVLVGYSGNTGSSGGPHLHFEIRDANARPMNPFLFGIDIKDSSKPLVSKILAYPLDKESQINGSQKPIEIRLTPLKNGNLTAETIKAKGKIGFGIATVDKQDLANNKNGIYEITSSLNGSPNFTVKMDKFSFAETRYINRMIDYSYYKRNKDRVQKLFVENNNPLSIYSDVSNFGILQIEDSLSYHYAIEVKDFKNNRTAITIPIQGTHQTIVKDSTPANPNYYYYTNQSLSFEDGLFEVYIPKNALYENTSLDLKTDGDILYLHKEEIPIHKNISLYYDLSNYATRDQEKLFIGRYDYKDELFYVGANIKNGKLMARTRNFGNYGIGLDKTPPTIAPINFNDDKWISKNTSLKLKIEDDVSGIKGYRATVNGKFILMEYDYKTDTLTHDFSDNRVTDTENHLKVIVTDNVGNSTTFESTFFRKN